MADEEKKQEEVVSGKNNLEDSTNQDYISAIKEMKANSVPREDYLKLKNQNKELLQSLINGDTIEAPKKEDKPDILNLIKETFTKDCKLDNLPVWKNFLTIREQEVADGLPDPFLPIGHGLVPTEQDKESANRVATIVKECIDYADGDSSIFNNELQRRTVDIIPFRR